jgi:hypothetical protein
VQGGSCFGAADGHGRHIPCWPLAGVHDTPHMPSSVAENMDLFSGIWGSQHTPLNLWPGARRILFWRNSKTHVHHMRACMKLCLHLSPEGRFICFHLGSAVTAFALFLLLQLAELVHGGAEQLLLRRLCKRSARPSACLTPWVQTSTNSHRHRSQGLFKGSSDFPPCLAAGWRHERTDSCKTSRA